MRVIPFETTKSLLMVAGVGILAYAGYRAFKAIGSATENAATQVSGAINRGIDAGSDSMATAPIFGGSSWDQLTFGTIWSRDRNTMNQYLTNRGIIDQIYDLVSPNPGAPIPGRTMDDLQLPTTPYDAGVMDGEYLIQYPMPNE